MTLPRPNYLLCTRRLDVRELLVQRSLGRSVHDTKHSPQPKLGKNIRKRRLGHVRVQIRMRGQFSYLAPTQHLRGIVNDFKRITYCDISPNAPVNVLWVSPLPVASSASSTICLIEI